MPAKDYTKTWVCQIHRDYEGLASCSPGDPERHAYVGCGYRYVLHQELTETAYNVLVASDAV